MPRASSIALASLCAAGLVATAARADEGPAPAAGSVVEAGRDGHDGWAIWLGGGFHIIDITKTPLGDQLRDAGYAFDVMGPALSLAVERELTEWLAVGGSLDLKWLEGGQASGQLVGRRLPPVDMSLTRIAAGAYARAFVCLEYRGCEDVGLFFGASLGMSGGPTLWGLRGDTELGGFFRFDFALSWYIQGEHLLLSLDVGHAGLWQSGLGPDSLGHGFEWTPTVQARLGWRW